MQIAAILDPTFHVGRICFNGEEFVKRVTEAKQYSAVLYDEARSGLNARRSMSQMNLLLTNLLSKIRQKNLFIIMVLPSFFDMDKNIALWRSMALCHVYEKYNKKTCELERGYFSWYNRAQKKYIFLAGKKFYSYKGDISFHGSFRKYYPVDEEKYRARKTADTNTDFLAQLTSQVTAKEEKSRLQLLGSYMNLKNKVDMGKIKLTKKQMASIYGVSRQTLLEWEKKWKAKADNKYVSNTNPETGEANKV